jgi:probable phosphoglycerate mutase
VIRVWLIRHGQSASNAGLPSSDPESIPLTPLGRRHILQRMSAIQLTWVLNRAGSH